MNTNQITEVCDALANNLDKAAKLLAPRHREYTIGFYDVHGTFFYTFDPMRPDQDYDYTCAASVDQYVIRLSRAAEGRCPAELTLARFQHDALIRAVYRRIAAMEE